MGTLMESPMVTPKAIPLLPSINTRIKNVNVEKKRKKREKFENRKKKKS